MKDTVSFEEAIVRLEEINARLEDNACPLEEAMALFEEGVRLCSLCSDKLQTAKQKVITLTQAEQGATDV